MRARLPLHILLLHSQVSRRAHTYRVYDSFCEICGAWFGFGSGFGIGFTLLLTSSFTRSSPSGRPPFTQYPSPSCSLVRDGQTHPHRPRLVVSHSTCPPPSSSPHAHSFVLGPAVIKHTRPSLSLVACGAGLSFPFVYVCVVECAPASPYASSSSTHRFLDERTPIEATPLSATLGLGLGLGLHSSSHSPSHAPLLLATLS